MGWTREARREGKRKAAAAMSVCLAGFALAVASTRLLAGLLYGVSPTDFPTLLAVILLVLIQALPEKAFDDLAA